ncbi:MAG TPA: ion transporter [Flavobacteriaceae bacterium]|nr:ion transporter [Flavobacteriaceae bacterium]
MPTTADKTKIQTLRQKLYIIIYGTNTPAGKLFDVALLFFIILSVAAVMFETVSDVDIRYHQELVILEWIFTILFTLEYILRIISTDKPWKYIFSFYGIIDLLAILPMYLSFFISGSNILASIRALRLLRLFRVMKLMQFVGEATRLKNALRESRNKIIVFLYSVLVISMIVGTIMYIIEGPEAGFTSIPRSIYWTIVTLTTVGYGDIVPVTALGQFLSMIVMIIGYGVIAVPTGIVSAEFTLQQKKQRKGKSKKGKKSNGIICPLCNYEGHKKTADYCFNCGEKLKL